MRIEVRVSEQFSVRRGRERLPFPPDRTVAVLLVGLLANGESWVSREEVAKKLYPHKEIGNRKNALRQTLFRLKSWLGAEVVESRSNTIRLVPEMVGSDLERGKFDAWFEHPWIDEIRCRQIQSGATPIINPFTDLAQAVNSIAKIDKAAARSILVNSGDVLIGIPVGELSRLFSLTAPKRGSESFAYEHLSLRAGLALVMGNVPAARRRSEQMIRMATHQRSGRRMASAASFAMFLAIETGDMRGAETWLKQISTYAPSRGRDLLLAISRSAFLWNKTAFSEAIDTMLLARPLLDRADRATALHYWSNLSSLSAEAGDFDLACQCVEAAESVKFNNPGAPWQGNLGYAAATHLLAVGNYHDSALAFKNLAETAQLAGHSLAHLYALEGYSEALSKGGDVQSAAAIWHQIDWIRRESKMGSSPRVLARRARVLGLR